MTNTTPTDLKIRVPVRIAPGEKRSDDLATRYDDIVMRVEDLHLPDVAEAIHVHEWGIETRLVARCTAEGCGMWRLI